MPVRRSTARRCARQPPLTWAITRHGDAFLPTSSSRPCKRCRGAARARPLLRPPTTPVISRSTRTATLRCAPGPATRTPTTPFPNGERAFNAYWRRLADEDRTHLHALTLFTLTGGAVSALHSQEAPRTHALELIAGADPTRALDALFVNAPLRDYALRPRVNGLDPARARHGLHRHLRPPGRYARQAGFNVGCWTPRLTVSASRRPPTTDLINVARTFATRTTTTMTRPRTSTASPRLRPAAPLFPPTAGPMCNVGQQEEPAAPSVGEIPLETVDPAHGPPPPRCLA